VESLSYFVPEKQLMHTYYNLSQNNDLVIWHGIGQIEGGASTSYMINLSRFAMTPDGIRLF
jgi:hypothetical protein